MLSPADMSEHLLTRPVQGHTVQLDKFGKVPAVAWKYCKLQTVHPAHHMQQKDKCVSES